MSVNLSDLLPFNSFFQCTGLLRQHHRLTSTVGSTSDESESWFSAFLGFGCSFFWVLVLLYGQHCIIIPNIFICTLHRHLTSYTLSCFTNLFCHHAIGPFGITKYLLLLSYNTGSIFRTWSRIGRPGFQISGLICPGFNLSTLAALTL